MKADIVDPRAILMRFSTQLEGVVVVVSKLSCHVSNMDYHFDDMEGQL